MMMKKQKRRKEAKDLVEKRSEEQEFVESVNQCLSVVDLQAQPIHTEMVTRLLGNRVAVSPIVTVEPRRRKFHKPITLTIPLPKAAHKGMTNQYQTESPTLRLLCSITGSGTRTGLF